MAYIQKRQLPSGKVTYRARVRIKGSPEMSQCFPTRRQAKQWGTKMEADIRSGRYFGREEFSERTFGEFIDIYIEKELPKNPKSQVKLTNQLIWWKKRLGKYFLCHITPPMINALKDELLSEPTPRGSLRSQSTGNRYLAVLSRSLNVCVNQWGWIKENPMKKVPRFQEGKPRERFLTKEEIRILLRACKKSNSFYLYPVVLFAICSGARKGEILGLKWSDIDFKRGLVTFRDTKNNDTRSVPLNDDLAECLRSHRGKRIVFSEYVFPSVDGTKPACIRTAFERAVKKIGLDDVCFHSLRHTAASHLVMTGASAIEVAAILGHKTLEMTKRYSHLTVSATSKCLFRMNDEIIGEIKNVS
jgi:integrase